MVSHKFENHWFTIFLHSHKKMAYILHNNCVAGERKRERTLDRYIVHTQLCVWSVREGGDRERENNLGQVHSILKLL